MKKIFIIMLLIISFSSCDDYLKEENRTDVLADDLYTTNTGFESLVNTAYSGLRLVYSTPWMFCSGTDMYVDGRNASPAVGLTTYTNLSPGEVAVQTFYQNVYNAIQYTNTGLYYVDITEQVASTPERKGELKFLRAYFYFLLVQSFGGVPLVTDMYLKGEESSFDRNSEEEVYNFIVSEMNEALSLVPETQATFGRVSKRAIRHYLAKVYLTRGYLSFASADDFDKAASFADAAISGYNLSSISFNDLFWPGKEKNNEVLFSIQFTPTSIQSTSGGSIQASYFGPYHGGPNTLSPWRSYNLIPTSYVYSLFTADDARWEGTFMNIIYIPYYDFYNKADKSAVKITRYYPQAWEVDDVDDWVAADPVNREGATVIPYTITQADPLINIWEQPVQYLDNSTPAVRKFDDPKAVIATGGPGDVSTRDFYLARLGETFLIAAEAYLQLDDKVTAMARINSVRARAEKTPGALQLTVADDVTIDTILDERALELVGEFHRWFDLKRTGKLVERVMLYNKDVRGVPDAFVGTAGELKILRPIPQAALDLNTNKDFGQNPAYK